MRQTKRVLALGALLVGAAGIGGCASSQPAVTGAIRPAPGLVLAQFADGVGAIAPGSRAPIWSDRAAVSALDGSAVFSLRRQGTDRLVRLDRHTGKVVTSWNVAPGLSISTVAPGGRWIALTDLTRDGSTEIVVFDSTTGAQVERMTLSGNLAPEAFSLDGSLIFALDYRGDHYRVQTIEIATHRRSDTSDRDKLPPEDMQGSSVRGVLSADRTLLATLYRNPANAEEPAFVHVLDLEHGWSYCADLPQPFGTGRPGSDVIELTAANTVVVSSAGSSRLAEIHIDQVHAPSPKPVAVEYRTGEIAAVGAAFRSTPGFGHVIAKIPS
jgi:hypothetical protein